MLRYCWHSAEAVGSFGGAGREPTPPSSTAAPSHTPPRRGLRGFQATTGSRSLCRHGMPVCAAARGSVSAAADIPLPLDCPRAWLGCQAAFLLPIPLTGVLPRAHVPVCIGRQRRPEGAPDMLRCERAAVADLERTGDRRRTRVP